VAFATLVRGTAAFAGYAPLLLGRHGGETTAAFFAYAPSRALGHFCRSSLVRINNNRTHKKTNYARKLERYYSQCQWLLQTLLASGKFLASHNFLFKSLPPYLG
jgi:hypothetical protein